MDRDMTNFVPQIGMDVVGSDGDKVGEIDAVERDYFVVRKGFFFPQDHYIPMTAISSYDEDGRVYLNVTKDQALEQEWGTPPASTGDYEGADRTGMVETSASNWGQGDITINEEDTAFREAADVDRTPNVETGVLGDAGTVDTGYVEETVVDRTVDAGYADAATGTGYVAGTDVDRGTIDVHEEELTARTHEVERGEVRVHKDVIEQQQTLEVPVTEEEVEITRRHVDRAVTDADHAFEEGTIEVPLRGEEVDIEKRTRVVEEIDIDKTAREHTEVVDGTVRREEVHIEGDNIDVEATDRKRRDDVL
jgi:uncharacterized protein (TIGR02271 family)